jgi:Spy/CpxP family protein refolding chaperone
MPRIWRTLLLTTLVAFAAGALGVCAGLAFFPRPSAHDSLDAVVHRELNLTSEQQRALETIETRYAAQKRALEDEMRAATGDIATAVSEDKANTPRVQAAVDRFHMAMGQLQHATIAHVFEMRAVLTPEQQRRFDEIVRRQLTPTSEQP